MSKIFHHAKFEISSLSKKEFPFSEAEICFAGRSNAGKSTFLNALVGSKVSFCSKKPGKTVTVNFFKLRQGNKYLVDLPGYGFAKVPKALKTEWQDKVKSYFNRRNALRLICLIIDCKSGMTALDLEMFEYLETAGLPLVLIFNKYDSLKTTEREKFDQKFQEIKDDFAKNDETEIALFKISSKKTNIGEFKLLQQKLADIMS